MFVRVGIDLTVNLSLVKEIIYGNTIIRRGDKIVSSPYIDIHYIDKTSRRIYASNDIITYSILNDWLKEQMSIKDFNYIEELKEL